MGTNAISKKREQRRYDYSTYIISGILPEIEGIIGLAVEIKFVDDNNPLLIDIHKRFINKIYDLYKALRTLKLKAIALCSLVGSTLLPLYR